MANQQRKRRALVFWTGRRLALAFTAWQDYAIRKQLTGDKLQRAAAFWSKQALAAAFYGWIEGEAPYACWLPQHARLMRPHGTHLPAGQLCLWRTFLCDLCPALRQASISNLLASSVLASISTSWRGPRCKQQQVSALRPAASGSSGTCRARPCPTPCHWIAGSVHQQQKRAALSKATALWGSSALASTFYGWIEGVAEMQRKRAAVKRAASFWLSRWGDHIVAAQSRQRHSVRLQDGL